MAAERSPKVVAFTSLTSAATAPVLGLKYSQIAADGIAGGTHRMGNSVSEDGGSGTDLRTIVSNRHKMSSGLCSRRANLRVRETNQVELGEEPHLCPQDCSDGCWRTASASDIASSGATRRSYRDLKGRL